MQGYTVLLQQGGIIISVFVLLENVTRFSTEEMNTTLIIQQQISDMVMI